MRSLIKNIIIILSSLAVFCSHPVTAEQHVRTPATSIDAAQWQSPHKDTDEQQIFDCQLDLCRVNKSHNIPITIPERICNLLFIQYEKLAEKANQSLASTCPVPIENHIVGYQHYLEGVQQYTSPFYEGLLSQLPPELQKRVAQQIAEWENYYASLASERDADLFIQLVAGSHFANTVRGNNHAAPFDGPLPENLDYILMNPRVQEKLRELGVEPTRETFIPCDQCSYEDARIAELLGISHEQVRVLNQIGLDMYYQAQAIEEQKKAEESKEVSYGEFLQYKYETQGQINVNLFNNAVEPATTFLVDIDGDSEIDWWEAGIAVVTSSGSAIKAVGKGGLKLLGFKAAGSADDVYKGTTNLIRFSDNADEVIQYSDEIIQYSDETVEYANDARFIVDASGNTKVFLQNGLEVSEHATLRMTQRGISLNLVDNIVTSQTPFNYFHNGVWKVGYYDEASQVFIGTVDDAVTTVINDVGPNYIQNLINAAP